MAKSNNAALALAARLRALGDAELISLLRARRLRDGGIRDYFDLADRLSDPESILAALANLDRPTLTVIAVVAELSRSDAHVDSASASASASDDAVGAPTSAEIDAYLRALDAPITSSNSQLEIALALALVAEENNRFRADPSVIAELCSWPARGLPGLVALASAQPASVSALTAWDEDDQRAVDRAASEHAFSTTTAIGELIGVLQREPARELSRGGIALPDLRRIALATATSIDDVPTLVALAARAGLVVQDAGRWLVTPRNSEWLLQSSASRWGFLSGAWLNTLNDGVRELLRTEAHAPWGGHCDDFIEWLYPAGSEQLRPRIESFAAAARLLGIVYGDHPSTPGSELLDNGPTAAATAMAALFPQQVTAVYLQHDLSIVAPGPLEPRLDARLRTMATVESRGLAASFRISSASLNQAMSRGETAETITTFLTDIALTGIPQPLEYLIAETAARFGLVRVSSLDDSTPIEGAGGVATRQVGAVGSPRTGIQSTDGELLDAMLVDQSLSKLALRRVSVNQLTSRADAATVFWSLSDARYPVVAEDATGAVVALERWRTSRSATATGGDLGPGSGTGTGVGEGTDAAAVIVARLRLLGDDEPEATGRAWLERQLEVAIKAKALIVVTISMQDGSTSEYLLQPTSLAGGRLRALDRKSDIERTLPVSHISAVRIAD